MPEHFLRLPDATTLTTPSVEAIDDLLVDVIDQQALGVVYGPAGTGKTYAVDVALERYHETRSPKARSPRIVPLVFTHTPTMLSVARGIVTALRPWMPVSKKATRYDLQELVLEELADIPHLLVVDEAQRLSSHAMEVLRYLYDDRKTQLSLLLVGGNGCWKVISSEPMLSSRVHRRHHCTPLPAAEVPTIMRAYHPLYHQAPPQLLAQVDDAFTHGNWRAWASFTATAHQLAQAQDLATLTATLADQTYTRLGHGDPNP